MTSSQTDSSAVPRYSDPVRCLVNLGRPEGREDWLDYVKTYGFGSEHVPELVRLMADRTTRQADSTSSEVWGPLHAWRALGQLRDARVIPDLLEFLAANSDDEWATEEFRDLFGMVGPAAQSSLGAFVLDPATPGMAATTAVEGLVRIAQGHPETRDETVALLGRRLQGDDDFVNGCVLAALLELRAVESIDAIREAFGRDAVDWSIAGDLEDAEIEFGLRTARSSPRKIHPMFAKLAEIRELMTKAANRPPPAAAKHAKVGRNEPCPCGSGKKYKRCCLEARVADPA